MVIACDIDGVLNNLMGVVIDVYNDRYGTDYTLNDITTYNIDNCLEPSVAKQIKAIFNEPNIWDKVKPIAASQDALQKLINKGHQVYLVTDHNPDTYGEKVAWVQRFYPFIEPSKIICIKDKWLLRADIMIEDCLQTLLTKPYYHRILVDHPWNRKVFDYAYDIHRCIVWDEIVDVIDEINERESDIC